MPAELFAHRREDPVAEVVQPREEKRSWSAVVSTGVGMPSSIAAIAVQRPSPESETRPAKSSRSGESRIAAAVRSSSQEPITLPRRQTSATSGRSRSYW